MRRKCYVFSTLGVLFCLALFCPPARAQAFHSADQNTDNIFSLGELLRVIQLFNVGRLSCASETQSEDGYLAENLGDQNCAPHSSDYDPQDWIISLNELLRLIQLYNACGYLAMEGTEDGFEPVMNVCPSVIKMVSVPAGTFPMGINFNSQYLLHDVTLSAYLIGKYEITNQQFVETLNWANAMGYLDSISSSSVTAHGQILLPINGLFNILYDGVQFAVAPHFNTGEAMELHPIDRVSWYGAVVFCNWRSEMEGLDLVYDTATWEADFGKNGYRLPTEAEWERAASWDGTKKWTYGNSSDTISCYSANVGSDGRGGRCYSNTSPVGFFNGVNLIYNGVPTIDSQSPVGCYDMSGNVYEWCHDWYDANYYGVSPANDPTGPETGTIRVGRGGNLDSYEESCITRHGNLPTIYNFGFRVARRLFP